MSYFEHIELWETFNDTQKIMAVYSVCAPLFELYEVICDEKESYIKPEKDTIELCNRLGAMAIRPVLPEEYVEDKNLLVTDFPNLNGNQDDIQREWYECKPNFFKYLQSLEKELLRRHVDINKRFHDVLLDAAVNYVKHYRKLKASKIKWQKHKSGNQSENNLYPATYYFKQNIYYAGDIAHILYFRNRSMQYMLMKLLHEAKGAYIYTSELAKRTRIDETKVRHALAALKIRIRNDNRVGSRITIEGKKGSGYRLISLASKA